MQNLDIKKINEIFWSAIEDYHIKDDVNQEIENPYEPESLEFLLYKKAFIDTIQWHLEDIIRKPDIDPAEALQIKRRIDQLNQQRTDTVELLDDFLFDFYKNVVPKPTARLNTESLGWALDRLSILNLKIYHWKEETQRKDTSEEHLTKAKQKLDILYKQFDYLNKAIEQLFVDLQNGDAIAQTYKQMKMYNDPELNPILREYKNKNR